MSLEKDLEQIITARLDGMPNYEEYMVNSTMKVLVVKDIIEYLTKKAHNNNYQESEDREV